MASTVIGTVYLIHFASKVNGKLHYVGFTRGRPQARLQKHLDLEGSGAQLIQAAAKKNVDCHVARTWPLETCDLEKKLKNEKNLKRHCPACQETGLVPREETGLVPREETGLVPRNAG